MSQQARYQNGYLRLFTAGGIPVRAHWTTPIVALLVAGPAIAWPTYWIAVLLLLSAHQAGHAWLAHRCALRVTRVDFQGVGGVCAWRPEATARQEATIGWGGLLAQAACALAAGLWVLILGGPATAVGKGILWAFTVTNAVIAGLNLIPIASFDGARAWNLVPMLARDFRLRRAPQAPEPTDWDEMPQDVRDEVDRVLSDISAELSSADDERD